MELPRVAAFTDTYLPTVNGVTYTVKTWRDRWSSRGSTMDIVYPGSDHEAGTGEHPVASVAFPFYEGFRVGVPQVPEAVAQAKVVHAHTPFSLGVAGYRLARNHDTPLVASYHTPTSEYASYISVNGVIKKAVRSSARRYERWFLDRADLIVAPSERTAAHVRTNVGVDTPVEVVANGVDVDFFQPVDTASFRESHDLPDGNLVGYTGRHGYEKCLDDVLDACEGLDVTIVFGGDGPARTELERRAKRADLDAHFLGFLDREELPAFYAALDVFAFPSPIETQGIVALEANTCGTPVVGVDSGALSDTIVDGETGYRYPEGDVAAFRERIERTLSEYEDLRETCLDHRNRASVEHSVDRLAEVYNQVRDQRQPRDEEW